MSDTLEHDLEAIASTVPDPPAGPQPAARPATGPAPAPETTTEPATDPKRGAAYPYNPWIAPVLDLTAVLPLLTSTVVWAIDPAMGRFALPLTVLALLVAGFRAAALPRIEARSAVRACEARWDVTVMSVGGFDPHAPRSRRIAYLDHDDRLAHAQLRYRDGRAWLLGDDHRPVR